MAGSDRINPVYYQSAAGVEAIDVIEKFGLGFCRGNAFKYLFRHRAKNGREDLVKALWYLEREAAAPPKLGPILSRVDRVYRFLGAIRRQVVFVDLELLAGVLGMAGDERAAFVEIVKGDPLVAKRHVEALIVAYETRTIDAIAADDEPLVRTSAEQFPSGLRAD